MREIKELKELKEILKKERIVEIYSVNKSYDGEVYDYILYIDTENEKYIAKLEKNEKKYEEFLELAKKFTKESFVYFYDKLDTQITRNSEIAAITWEPVWIDKKQESY